MHSIARFALAFGLATFLASQVYAAPIINSRGAPIATQPSGETTLQGMLNGILVGPGTIDALNGQSNIGSFRPTATTSFTFIGAQAGFSSTNEFWVYDSANPSHAYKLYDGVPGPSGEVVGNVFGAGDLASDFGFMLDVLSSYRLYSDDTLNPGDLAQALVYVGGGQGINIGDGTFGASDIIIAFEDLRRQGGGSDDDFNDILVLIENVIPGVLPPTTTHSPEPGSIIVWSMLSGIAGVASWRRWRKTRAGSAP